MVLHQHGQNVHSFARKRRQLTLTEKKVLAPVQAEGAEPVSAPGPARKHDAQRATQGIQGRRKKVLADAEPVMPHYGNFFGGGEMTNSTSLRRARNGNAWTETARATTAVRAGFWIRLHDLSLGIVVGILLFLVMLVIAAAGFAQTRHLAGDQPNDLASSSVAPNFWAMVEPESEEIAALGFAGSGMGPAAFEKARTLPKLHGPMYHVADVEGGYASIRSTASPLKCSCFTADGGNGSMVFHLSEHFGIAGDGARVWAPSSATAEGLNMTTYLGGPQFSAVFLGHLLPFGHFLLGKATADGLNGTGTMNAFADAFGGGLDLVLNRDTSVRLAEIDEEFTHFHEATGPQQSNLRLVFGVVFHFKTK